MTGLRVLSIAAGTGKIGYVFLVGGKLEHWILSAKASETPELAAQQAERWIDELESEVVITEKLDQHSRKGALTKQIIAAIAEVAEDRYLNDIKIPHVQKFQNKYEEAQELAKLYPDILSWMPKKPRIWEREPRNMIYFEALALAHELVGGEKVI